jgi:hypothetical protein
MHTGMETTQCQTRKSTMSGQGGPPLQGETSEPVLSVGGMSWDVSNLCSTRNKSYSLPPNRRLDRPPQGYPDQRRREQSIYPSKEDLGRCLPRDIDTSDDIFGRSRSPPPPSRSDAKEFHQLNGPSIYDCYSRPLSRDPADGDADHEFSEFRYGSVQEERYYSRWDHGGSRHEGPNGPPSMAISDCSSDVSSYSSGGSSAVLEREASPVQVEVYPGEFLTLRGAKETVEAIERGDSTAVSCCACGLGLRCVADCQLVICPDCTVMSPVPRRRASAFKDTKSKNKGTSSKYQASLPQFPPLWTDDDESSYSSKQEESNIGSSTGGIGLGVSIDRLK